MFGEMAAYINEIGHVMEKRSASNRCAAVITASACPSDLTTSSAGERDLEAPTAACDGIRRWSRGEDLNPDRNSVNNLYKQ